VVQSIMPSELGSEPRLELSHIAVDYGYGRVVSDFAISVRRGELVALVGPNGAGKTSVLKAASGFVHVDAGTVVHCGHNVTRVPAHIRSREGLVLIPDDRGLFPALTVIDNLWLAHGKGIRSGSLDMDVAFELVPELRSRRRQVAGSLSGGEQQMLALAQAMLQKPRTLLIDELSAGLAPLIVDRIFSRCRQLVDSLGISILVVEQYIGKVLKVADRAVVMVGGAVVLEGEPRQLSMDEIAAAYFG
jgi:branched-chain amino acid transport system ATP-binding protein